MLINELSAAFLLPVYNAETTISTSIRAVLNQDYNFFKLVIIDNGSTDNTSNIIKEFQESDHRVIIYTLKEASLTKALSYGIKNIKEDLILRIDADDICERNRLRKTIEFMQKNPNCSISYCNFKEIYENNLITIETPNKLTAQDIIFNNPLAHSTYCLRRKSLNKAKLNYYGLEDKIKYHGPSQDLMLISSAIFNFNFNISRIKETEVYIYKDIKSISNTYSNQQKTNASKILLVNALTSFLRGNTFYKLVKSLFCIIINILRLLYHRTNLIIILKILFLTTNFHINKKLINYSFILSI